jgi:hypothetical protein
MLASLKMNKLQDLNLGCLFDYIANNKIKASGMKLLMKGDWK